MSKKWGYRRGGLFLKKFLKVFLSGSVNSTWQDRVKEKFSAIIF